MLYQSILDIWQLEERIKGLDKRTTERTQEMTEMLQEMEGNMLKQVKMVSLCGKTGAFHPPLFTLAY